MFRLFFIATLLLILPLSSVASAVYKYRDAQGIWHYSDARPAGQRVETFALAESEPQEKTQQVTIERRGSAEFPEFVAINPHWAPVEVKFWLTEAANLRQQAHRPIHVTVPPQGERRIVVLGPQDAALPSRYRYQYRWQLGDPAARHLIDHVYLPPVPVAGSFTISQAFDGGFSHNSPASRHAIDIPMPVGTPVRAARAGRVVSVRMGSNSGGSSPTYRSLANTIYIEHADGTYGVYAHLRHRSALVEPGQTVRTGQIIAQSGNTGYSTAPHLHFAVLRNAGLHWESERFMLVAPEGPVTPVRGLALNGVPVEPGSATAAWGQPTNSNY